MRAICLLFLPALLAGCATSPSIVVPVVPSPRFGSQAYESGSLSKDAVRAQIETVLPSGTALVMTEPPASPAGPISTMNARSAPVAEPLPAVTISDRYPIVTLSDNSYALLNHLYVPVLLDWFDDLTATLGAKQGIELRERGLLANKVARLMRVFTSMRLCIDNDQDHNRQNDRVVPPAIGWCRMYLKEDWGPHKRGETDVFVLVGTDQGWIVIDPFIRYSRRLQKNDPYWIPQFIVL